MHEKNHVASSSSEASLLPRDEHKVDSTVPAFSNIAVVHCNFMKHCPNFFAKAQLEKIFFCFADPHFKRSNHRRRIISQNFLDLYAYVLQEHGLLYTITDVKDLHHWMVQHLVAHPLFSRLKEEEWAGDPCVGAMENTDEGKKVTRQGGMKYIAIFRRLSNPPLADLL